MGLRVGSVWERRYARWLRDSAKRSGGGSESSVGDGEQGGETISDKERTSEEHFSGSDAGLSSDERYTIGKRLAELPSLDEHSMRADAEILEHPSHTIRRLVEAVGSEIEQGKVGYAAIHARCGKLDVTVTLDRDALYEKEEP